MFNPFKEDTDLDEAITSGFADLKAKSADEKEFATMVDQLTKLYSLKAKRLDPNTLVVVAGNIFIGLKVLKFEDRGIVTSKIWSFLSKL